MNEKNLDKLIKEALAIEEKAARDAGTIGYMARALVQATMPHKDPGDVKAWGRENGNFSMVMQPGYVMKKGNAISTGLPYGTYPRLLLAWLTTEAVKTKEQTIVLGESLSDFMRQLDIIPSGGRWGTIGRLREQMRRLFSASISCTYDNTSNTATPSVQMGKKLDIASAYELWWDPKSPEQSSLWQSSVTLGSEFFKEIINRPVPIDMRALKALKGSSMRLDIYIWLTYRMSYLETKTAIPWPAIQAQLGADFHRKEDFKRKFLSHLKAVEVIYSGLKIDSNSTSLILKPSLPHIAKK